MRRCDPEATARLDFDFLFSIQNMKIRVFFSYLPMFQILDGIRMIEILYQHIGMI